MLITRFFFFSSLQSYHRNITKLTLKHVHHKIGFKMFNVCFYRLRLSATSGNHVSYERRGNPFFFFFCKLTTITTSNSASCGKFPFSFENDSTIYLCQITNGPCQTFDMLCLLNLILVVSFINRG